MGNRSIDIVMLTISVYFFFIFVLFTSRKNGVFYDFFFLRLSSVTNT